MTFALLVFSPIIRASGKPGKLIDVSPNWKYPDVPMKARGWRRSIRGFGGYWQGEFTLYGNTNDLAHFFYHNLGGHIEERSGGKKTWEGLIYEMELTTDGSTRRRTFDSMYNHVRVQYYDTNNELNITSAATNDGSIQTYGRRELIWPLDSQDQTPAENVRDKLLQELAYPRAKTAGTELGIVGDASLFVRACGYVFTANWRYESAGDDTDDDLSTWVEEIIATDCTDFLQQGRVQANTDPVRKETRIEMRAWDVITKMLEIGIDDGTNQVPARAYVDNERFLHYEEINTTPVYFKRGGGFYTAAGARTEANPWQVKPAVVRDLTYPIQTFELDAWLDDARDWYMNEVDVWDNQDGTAGLIPKGEEFNESDILTAQENYKRQIQRMQD